MRIAQSIFFYRTTIIPTINKQQGVFMLTRHMICSLALCVSMISTIHANSVQMVLQKDLMEQGQQNNVLSVIKEEVVQKQLSEEEQRIAGAVPKDIKDWVEEFHQDMASSKPFITLPKLIEVPQGIQELDMAKAVSQKMDIPVVHIDKAYHTKAYGYEYFPIHRHPDVVDLMKKGHKHIAIVIDAIDTYEHQWRASRYVCDLLDQASRSKFITILTARSIDEVDPLIRGRIDRSFRMEPVVDVYDRHELVRSFFKDEISVGDIYDNLVPFIAEHTEGFSPLDLDFLTARMRATIKRAGIGPRGMPLDRAELLINARKIELKDELLAKAHPVIRFCKEHKFMSCIVAPVVSVMGLGAIIRYIKTHYKDLVIKKK